MAAFGPQGGPGLGVLEQRVVRPRGAVRVPVRKTAHSLHSGRHEHIAFAGFDRVSRHADRLQGRGAVAVNGHARDPLEAREQGDNPGEVEARFARRLAVADHEVLDLSRVELGHLCQEGLHHLRTEVIGPHVDERAFEGPPDGAAGGCNDDRFSHGGEHRQVVADILAWTAGIGAWRRLRFRRCR